MKRILVLFTAAMLCAAPAFAMPGDSQATQSATVKAPQSAKGGSQGSKVENSISQTQVEGTTAINNGKNNTIEVGGISAQNGGTVRNSVDQTQMRNSTIINNGESNSARFGGISAK